MGGGYMSWCLADCGDTNGFAAWVGSQYSCIHFIPGRVRADKCAATGEMCRTHTETCPYELNTKG